MTTATKKVAKSAEQCLIEMRNKRQEHLETFDASKTERINAPSLGDVVRQGDVYLICINKLPEGKPTDFRQIVPGTTQGSRHVIEGDAQIVKDAQFKLKDRQVPQQLIGPAFHCVSDVTVTHPEHGHKVLPAGTTWQTVYQQAFDVEIRRAQD